MKFEYEVIDKMPFDIKYPKDYEEWIRKSLPAAMFYDRFKKVMHCTRCGYTGDYDYKIRKNDRVVCPHCGEELTALPHTTPHMYSGRTFIHFWKTKKAIYYAEVGASWVYQPDKEGDELAKAVLKDYSRTRNQEEHVRVMPYSFGRISRSSQEAWDVIHTYSEKKGASYGVRKLEEPRLIDGDSWHTLHPNTARLLSNTFLGVDRFSNLRWPKLLIKELTLHAKYPAAEYVVKAGLGEYVQNTIEGWSRTYIRPNWRAKTLPGFLRMKAQDIDKLRKWNRLDVDNIAYYKKLLKYRKKPQLEELELIYEWLELGALYSGRIHGDPVKLARYFEKQLKKSRYYKYKYGLISDYMDYERMISALGYPEDDDYYRFPKDLNAAHDAIIDEYNAHLAAERKRKAAEERKKKLEEERLFIESILPNLQKYNMEDDKYLIRALESADDFRQEGIHNHNCVGTYAERALKGKAKVFVLRKVEAPEISFVTIELALDEKSIKQCYGTGNRLPDEEVKAWVDHWLKTVVNSKKKRRKKAA